MKKPKPKFHYNMTPNDEVERKLAEARLEEAKWWMDEAHYNRVLDTMNVCACFQCERIAQLEAAAKGETK